ncbi:hypothetical protein [Alcanivorax sp.]|uniref:hypothetical protein n=1 Tax=Alcanivorax sp. TaxID=1872427 RepID=UPI003A9179D4
MAITSDDIKLMQPERLTDNDDGGGQMTGREVVDGDINNLFEDISRVDRTYGEVSLRKSFLKVDTDTADLYLDAHSIISAQPLDPNVTGLLFTTQNFYDERAGARQRVESFVVPGPVTGLALRGNQLQGQRSVICFAPTVNNVTAPEIGETLLLQEGEDLSTQQFIKILNVTTTTETFTYQVNNGDIRTFTADQYILELSAELKQDFPAADPSPKPGGPSLIYSTQPATSAKYYGSTSLATAASGGDLAITVADTFAPIIPTASNETPVIDQRPGGYVSQVVAIGPNPVSIPVTIGAGDVSTLPTAVVPGSVSFSLGGETYTDKGGVFVAAGGGAGNLDGATIDYGSGLIAWEGAGSGSVTLNYRPGALRQQIPNTGRIDIDESNRNFNYVLSLDPAPSPLSLHLSYQYLGKWYTLADDGTGSLVGNGSGQVNYATGSVIATLQAQPDAGSVIFYRWTDASIYLQDPDAYDGVIPLSIQLGAAKVVAGSVTLSWDVSGSPKTATDVAADGAITGDATGRINYSAGEIDLTTALNADGDVAVEYTHKDDADQTSTVTVPDNDDQSDIIIETAAGIEPGSVDFTILKSVERKVVNGVGQVLSTSYISQSHWITDNGDGALLNRRDLDVVGTVNYSTGQLVVAGATFLKQVNG